MRVSILTLSITLMFDYMLLSGESSLVRFYVYSLLELLYRRAQYSAEGFVLGRSNLEHMFRAMVPGSVRRRVYTLSLRFFRIIVGRAARNV